MWTRKELKARGHAAFQANYWKSVLVALIFALVAGGFASGSGGRFPAAGGPLASQTSVVDEDDLDEDEITSVAEPKGSFEEFKQEFEKDMKEVNVVVVAAAVTAAIIIFLIVLAIVFAISAVLLNPAQVGCHSFFLKNLEEPANLNQLTVGFESNYKNVVKVMFFRDLYLFLWGLIPLAGIVISIVKRYEYMMIPYLVAENPDIDRDEAFARSREMMNGQKWKAFVLDLSFIGWHLLSILTLGILSTFYVRPYVQSTRAALYDTIKA
ncbi:MAG: DUF975 family protein [Lachnospiraceae bacterium]|nr:DUF975 family protein [Lachnospiraceae bacterium]